MLAFLNDPLDSPAARETWRQGEDEGEHPDRGERKDRDELTLRAEEERDAENRQQFADRACRHDVAAERPASRLFSRRIGNSVPSAVVVRANATGTNACTKPMAARTPTSPAASAAVITQPVSASRPARSRNTAGSSS